ncbi:response regulator [Occallatibacter savannae]|uniref:response regulator n=1 Tax=Occallatibacter savannae TaxID=1002691 RepID=UPI000D6884C7|nr:response regulator [Occallatibacter savannae]
MALNIMIVDDSPVMRVFLRKVVQLTGLSVGEYCEAGDGASALKSLRERWVDLILTDINMPGMNGEEFVRQLDKDEMLRDIPVIVVSTDASSDRIDRMFKLGAKGYISKPFQPETLRDEVEKILGAEYA